MEKSVVYCFFIISYIIKYKVQILNVNIQYFLSHTQGDTDTSNNYLYLKITLEV